METPAEKTPFFSICIPAYNGEEFLHDCLESVARQTFDDWEVVVLDDESTDRTADVCETQNIIPLDKYTFVRGDHQGLLQTRMRLLRLAKGHVIISLDNDDMLIDRTALEQIHAAFVEYQCDVVMFNACRSLKNPEKKLVNYRRAGICGPSPLNVNKVRRGFYTTYYLNSIFLKAYKRGAINPDLTYPDAQKAEDRLQCLQIFSSCQSIALIDKPLYFYRENLSSIMNKPFTFKDFEEQMATEAEVDKITRDWSISDEDRLHLRSVMVVGALELISKTVADKSDRLDLYRAIEGSSHIELLKSGSNALKGIRLDRRFMLGHLLRKDFDRLDKVIALNSKLKSPIWKMMGRRA